MRGAAVAYVLAACGRVGFDDVTDAKRDAALDVAAPALAYVGPVVGQQFGQATSDSFPLQAHAAGDLVLVFASCNQPDSPPTGATMSATGWTFTPLAAVATEPGGGFYAAAFAGFAPDTTATTAFVAWPTVCNTHSDEMGDEFAGAALDAQVVAIGSGACATTVPTAHADDAIWAGCYSTGVQAGVGPGFLAGATDGDEDVCEYRLGSDPAGTEAAVAFTGDGGGYVVAAVALARE
jgi:hypothetical protein